MVAQKSTRSATPDPSDKRLGKLQRKRKQFTLTAGLILGVLVLGIILFSNDIIDLSSRRVAAQTFLTSRDPFEPRYEIADNIALSPKEEVEEDEPGSQTPEETVEPPEPAVMASIPTQANLIQYEENAPILYYAQSGDSIGILAVRFGVETSEITSTAPLPTEGFIPEGQLLLIPSRLQQTSSKLKLFPDSEVVNSPSSIGFDTNAFVQQAGGYLAGYSEAVYAYGTLSGADIIDKVAQEFAIHPRLLLALLEYQSGWVYGGPPATDFELHYPLDIKLEKVGLYHQLVSAAGVIESGYYGWREGTVATAEFKDGWKLRLAAELNCGSVGLMQFFASLSTFEEWSNVLYGETGFLAIYNQMFGDPWMIAQQHEPLFTPDVLQPELILPFQPGIVWSFTVGPHAAWGAADVRAALDFAPPSAEVGCHTNWSWITSAGAGLVVRSSDGTVVVDMDGDGFEQTGWNIIYLHVGTVNRVPVGTWLEAGDKIGHPSCEGGISTGTHLHIARKYNGEWVPAEGPLAFVMSGWKSKASSDFLEGWLVRGEEVRTASIFGAPISHISR
ncbi:MAG: M23 family metallopeptidase [Anaerolineaceae bacterium]|nr:M23 family metallopeptidase [Anaerolineaceae bacterium]MDD4043710.1 M23 family metallopeptidase [Anaerolineaceae bacterium]MDD4578607.1 M23 family metallopeptidase [Anaerolineaceae bacterium]